MSASSNENQKNTNLPDSIFDLASVGMLIFSSDGKVIKINNEALKIFDNNDQTRRVENLFSMDALALEDWKHNAEGTISWESIYRLKDTGQPLKVYFNPIVTGNKKSILCQIKKINEPFDIYDNLGNRDYLIAELINNIPDNIFIKDKESRFILANNNTALIMGVKLPGDLTGKTDFDFYPVKLAKKYRNDELEVMEKGVAKLNIIEQVISSKHERKWFSTSKLPLRNSDGEIIGIMGIGRDITPLIKEKKALRKAKNDAEKADKLKSSFLANLSHEIRTPLNGILGFSQFLSQYIPNDPKAEKYVDFIMKNGKRLLNLISDIIDISKIESGQFVIKKKPFSLNELINNLEISAAEDVRSYDKQNLKVIAEKSLVDENCYIFNDDRRIGQVLHNLIVNAIKYTNQGSIKFGYKVVDRELTFFVKDTGIGIKDDDLHNIFNLFTQVDGSLGRQHEGAGLGLSIAKGIVTLMGGKINVTSVQGKGSEFSFTIPYVKYTPDIENQELPVEKRILVLGSDIEIAGIIESNSFLESLQIDFAPSKEALETYLKSAKPDIIIYRILPHDHFDEYLEWYLNNHTDVHLLILSANQPKTVLIIPEGVHAETIEEPVNPLLFTEKIKLLLKPSN